MPPASTFSTRSPVPEGRDRKGTDLAEPAAVFLYRGETREVAERLGIDCSRFPGPIIPVIYNVNFRNPEGYFLATKFQMRNKDVIYVMRPRSRSARRCNTSG